MRIGVYPYEVSVFMYVPTDINMHAGLRLVKTNKGSAHMPRNTTR